MLCARRQSRSSASCSSSARSTSAATDRSSGAEPVTLATIGVYGWTLEEFLAALHAADVQVVLDVRQRRGVRGREYAWANSQRLQAALAEAGVAYRHRPDLAPTTELRKVQYEEDARVGVGKRNRVELAPEYRERYLREILDRVDLNELVTELPAEGGGRPDVRRRRSR